MASGATGPFAYQDGPPTRRSVTADMDAIEELLNDTDTVEVHESLLIWDLYMKAQEWDRETMRGQDAVTRLEQYPDDYQITGTEIMFDPDPDTETTTYTITITGKRHTFGKRAQMPPTQISGTIDQYEDLETELEEYYDIKTTASRDPSPHTTR
ncbi:MAG: hypothetical protein MUP66_02610 [Candidatus Nanohaloarchaeota archaeon QJJ-5]|nr:hypothetical protein [Candidatus Nanohaloarchaeota archaeon QJJ-5]